MGCFSAFSIYIEAEEHVLDGNFYMFETEFGRELRHFSSVISPVDGFKEWSLIEVYFSTVRDVPLAWFDGISGSADIKLYVKQQCLDREIKNVRDFIIATQPMLLQNPDSFSRHMQMLI